MLFVDFKKALDAINRGSIWLALSSKGIPAMIIRLIRALYGSSELAVLHNGNISDPFTTNAGVRQLTLHKRGIVLRHLEDLDFFDNIRHLSHKLTDMQVKADRLVTLSRTVGLEVNTAKAKAMRVNHNKQARQMPSEIVESFYYLGCNITAETEQIKM